MNRFVDLERNDTVLTRRWGQIDTPGRSRSEDLRTKNAALLAFERQVRGLEGKGYTAGHQHPELVSIIERDPEEEGPYLVYADWLLDRDDARGMLIRWMAERQEAKARAWLDAHAEQLCPRSWATYTALEWRLGFISRLTLRAATEGNAPFLLRRLLAHPSARFTRAIVIEGARCNAFNASYQLPLWRQVLSERSPLVDSVVLAGCSGLDPLVGIVWGVVCAAHPR